MAPEQIRGEDADPRSDIYSLAAVLFECLTGVVPFRRGTEIAVMYAHLEQLPPSVSSIRGGLPEEIDPVIRRGMAKHPDDRQQTATRLIVEAGVALFGRAAALGAPQPPLEHATTRIARGSRSVGRIGVSLAADPPRLRLRRSL